MRPNLVVIDTEFTSFKDPLLLSIAAVADSSYFYAELSKDSATYKQRIQKSSDFVKEVVVPQFEKIAGCTYNSEADISIAFIEWAKQKFVFTEKDPLTVVFDSDYDGYLFRSLITESYSELLKSLRVVNIAEAASVAVAQMAMEDYCEFSSLKTVHQIKEHHALFDAYALDAGLRVIGLR